MSIWNRIADALKALREGESLADVFDRLKTPPERSVGFTIAVIALGAKMAKADGQVTRDEVAAFREVFQIAEQDERAAARVFNLARQDAAGYEHYAQRIRNMFGDELATLCDVMEGLFHIALADGAYHPGEDRFLRRVAKIFGIPAPQFAALRARFVPEEGTRDPYAVLGLTPDASHKEARAAWRALVRETHPDRMVARGVPEEAIRLAERRMQDINRAWEEISASRA